MPPDLAGWPKPKPLDGHSRPPFPVDALPGWLGGYVSALAEETQTPPDLAGMLSLSILSCACAKRAVVEPRPNWREPLSLWVVAVLGPGNRKSAVFNRMVAPVARFESEWARLSGPGLAVAWSERRTLEEKLKRAESNLAKAAPEVEGGLRIERDELAELLGSMTLPSVLRLLVEDITSESLTSILAEQGGRIALLSDEGGPFDLMAGRYSKSGLPNLDVWLKGDSGGSIRVDRRGRASEFVGDPALTLGLAVQPDVVRVLADRPGFRGRGLLARFLYCWPAEMVGSREIEPTACPTAVEQQYAESVFRLLAGAERLKEQPDTPPLILRLDSGASEALTTFNRWLEPRLAEHGALGPIRDWGSKLVGKVARIAGLVHVAERRNVTAAAEVPIAAATLTGATDIGRYMIEHALTAFGEMGSDHGRTDARAILAWVKSGERRAFTKREAFNGMRGQFKEADRLDAPLKLLEDLDYVLAVEDEGPRGPGRPSRRFEVNPYVLTQNAQYPQNRGLADSADLRALDGQEHEDGLDAPF